MNQFELLAIHAQKSAEDDPVTQLLASDEYALRAAFPGESGIKDQLRVQLYMLKRIALDPSDVERIRGEIKRGVVCLRFFGFSNPCPFIEVDPNSPAIPYMAAAIEKNVASRMSDAARRLRKWRGMQKSISRQRYEEAIRNRERSSPSWPTGASWKADPEKSKVVQDQLIAGLNAKTEEIRARHSARIQVFARASAPGVTSWTGLLKDIAVSVLASKSATA